MVTSLLMLQTLGMWGVNQDRNQTALFAKPAQCNRYTSASGSILRGAWVDGSGDRGVALPTFFVGFLPNVGQRRRGLGSRTGRSPGLSQIREFDWDGANLGQQLGANRPAYDANEP